MSTTKPGYIPPLYRNIAKDTKDLFKQKYDYEHTVRVFSRNTNSLAIESGAILSDVLRGYVKANYNGFKFGRLSTELHTDASQESRTSFSFAGLPAGLSATASVSSKDKDKSFKGPVGTIETDYRTDYFSGGLVGKSDLSTHKVEAHIAIGTDGVTAGAHSAIDVSNGVSVQDLNYAVEYAGPLNSYICSAYTEKNANYANFAYFQRLSSSHLLGALFKYELSGKQDRTLSIGSQYAVDYNTTVKAKVDLPSGDVSTHVQHRLAAPNALVGLASSFSLRSQNLTAQKVGLNVSLGDF